MLYFRDVEIIWNFILAKSHLFLKALKSTNNFPNSWTKSRLAKPPVYPFLGQLTERVPQTALCALSLETAYVPPDPRIASDSRRFLDDFGLQVTATAVAFGSCDLWSVQRQVYCYCHHSAINKTSTTSAASFASATRPTCAAILALLAPLVLLVLLVF